MYRSAINELIKWKSSRRRKPLIIEGARQVGKTWLVKKFAEEHYKNIAYINFEQSIYLRNLFKEDFDIARIITAIGAATHVTCKPDDTLIFLDEIQEAPNGVTYGQVIPIEVKAEENLKAKSLRQFVADYKPAAAYRTSMSDYRRETWMTNIPLYCIQTL